MKTIYPLSIAMLLIAAALGVAWIHFLLNLKDIFIWDVTCQILSFGFVTLAIGLALFEFKEFKGIGENS